MSEVTAQELQQKQKSSRSKKQGQGVIDPNASQAALSTSVAAGISYLALGKSDGDAVLNAESSAFKVTREIILLRSKELGLGLGMQDGQLHVYARDWLDGYGQKMGKQRKKEVKAVFEASCIGQKELPVGFRKGDPNKLDDNTKKPEDAAHEYVVKATKTGIQWLESCSSYAALYDMARRVKDKTSTSSNVVKVKTKLGDTIVGKMQENLKAANESQAAVVLQAAADKLFRMADGDRLLVNQILGLAIRLASSKDAGIKGFAQEIGAKASDMVARIERSKLDAQTSGMVPSAPVANLTSAAIIEAPEAAQTETLESADKTGTNG